MSTITVDTVLPETSGIAENLNLGAVGDSVSVTGTLKTNKITDAGGNNLITSDGSGNLTVNSGFQGNFTLLNTNSPSGATASAFTTNIDSTYKLYYITWTGINPSVQAAYFRFQFTIDGTNFNVATTMSQWRTYHTETGGTVSGPGIATGAQQSTSYMNIDGPLDNSSDASGAGYMYLFNPASTTYVKCFTGQQQSMAYSGGPLSYIAAFGGYVNTTSAVTGVGFNIASGTFSGSIKLYGIG